MNLRAAIQLSLAVTLLLCLPAWSKCVEGMSLPAAESQDFFNWFHFKENERKAEPDQNTIVSFTTGVQSFSVQLGVILDKNKNISSMALVLPRDFVNDPAQGVLARDVAKSFLACAIADADLKSVQSLISEIEFGGQSLQPVPVKAAVMDGKTLPDKVLYADSGKIKVGGQAWIGTGAPPAPPATQSDGYLAYLGKKDEFTQVFSNCTLSLSNATFPGKLLIKVFVTSK